MPSESMVLLSDEKKKWCACRDSNPGKTEYDRYNSLMLEMVVDNLFMCLAVNTVTNGVPQFGEDLT